MAVTITRSLLVISYYALAINLAFGLPLPSLKPFIETPTVAGPGDGVPGIGSTALGYAWVVAIYSIGELLGSLLTGFLNTWCRTQRSLTLLNVVGLVGTLLYAQGHSTLPAVLAARLFTGMWSGGMNVIIRAYLNRTTPKNELGQVLSAIAFFCALAWAVSPGVGTLLARTEPLEAANGWLRFDKYRGPGWLMFALALGCAASQLCLADDGHTGTAVVAQNNLQYQAMADEEEAITDKKDTTPAGHVASAWWFTNGFSTRLLLVLFAAVFVFSFGFTAMETLAAPLMADQFGTDIDGTSTIFVAAALSSAASYALFFVGNRPGKRACGLHIQIVLSMSLLLIGFLVLIDYSTWFWGDPCDRYTCSYTSSSFAAANNASDAPGCPWQTTGGACEAAAVTLGCVWNRASCSTCPPVCHSPARSLKMGQLYAGFILNNLSFVIGRTATLTFFSGLIKTQPAHRAEAFMQGLLMSAGNVARIVGPLLVVSVYAANGNRTYGAMSVLASLALVVLVLLQRTFADAASAFDKVFVITSPHQTAALSNAKHPV